MAVECADDSEAYPFTCECGWHVPVKDTAWIIDQEVLHVICYNCGKEWVE